MNTGRNLRETWTLLSGLNPTAEALRVRESEDVETPNGRPLFALDPEGLKHLLVPVGDDATVLEDRKSSGVQIVSRRLDDGGRLRLFVDFVCRKPHLDELFLVVADEVLDQLAAGSTPADQTCLRVLNRWRELLEREVAALPAMEVLIGLFGELWHLREVSRQSPGAASSWIGPSGARHDFRAPGLALEVKTTRGRTGRSFEIHGHDQLEPPEGGDLFLAGMRIEPTPSEGDSIVSLIEDIAGLGADRQAVVAGVADAGLVPAAFSEAVLLRFVVRENRMYRVDAAFPRIVSESFAGGRLPQGVTRLSYAVDLLSEPPFPLEPAQVAEVYRRLGVPES